MTRALPESATATSPHTEASRPDAHSWRISAKLSGIYGGEESFKVLQAASTSMPTLETAPPNWTDPKGLDIVVVQYAGAGGNPAGHVGVGVNTDQTLGFYPQ